MGWRKNSPNHNFRCTPVGCSTTTEVSDPASWIFLAYTNSGILDIHFRRFLHIKQRILHLRQGIKHRHEYVSSFPMLHPLGFPFTDKSFLGKVPFSVFVLKQTYSLVKCRWSTMSSFSFFLLLLDVRVSMNAEWSEEWEKNV